MKGLALRFTRRIFRLINRLINPWGLLVSRPGVIHGSPAYSGATTWSRRLNQMSSFYKKIHDVDGAVVESGVHWGYGILIHQTAGNLVGPVRRIYGFDSFQGHSKPTTADFSGGNYKPLDSAFAITEDDVWKTLVLGTGTPKEDLEKNITLIPGWMQETMPEFLRRYKNTDFRVALIHADSDIYEPILVTLQNIWPLLQPNGIVILGYLGNPELMGKTKAVNEFLAQIPTNSYSLVRESIIGTDEQLVENSYLVKLI